MTKNPRHESPIAAPGVRLVRASHWTRWFGLAVPAGLVGLFGIAVSSAEVGISPGSTDQRQSPGLELSLEPGDVQSEDGSVLVKTRSEFPGYEETKGAPTAAARRQALEPEPGHTRVFRQQGSVPVLVSTYPWAWPFLLCDRRGEDIALVRLPSHALPGLRPEKQLGIGFYRNGKAVREYSAWELLPAVVYSPCWRMGLRPLRSVKGFSRGGGDTPWTFTVETCDYRLLTFDPMDGRILSVRDRVMECTNQTWFASELKRAAAPESLRRLVVGEVTVPEISKYDSKTEWRMTMDVARQVRPPPRVDVGIPRVPVSVLGGRRIQEGEVWGFSATTRLGLEGNWEYDSACRLYAAEPPTKYDREHPR